MYGMGWDGGHACRSNLTNVCDCLQTMVVNKFLAETSHATMGGFSAEYVNLGPEAEALEAGG